MRFQTTNSVSGLYNTSLWGYRFVRLLGIVWCITVITFNMCELSYIQSDGETKSILLHLYQQ